MRWVFAILALVSMVSAPKAEGFTIEAVLQAAYRGDLDTIRVAVNGGANLTMATIRDGDPFPINVLVAAVANSKDDVLELALQNATFSRADLNLALMLAINFEEVKSAERLTGALRPLNQSDPAFVHMLAVRPIQVVADQLREDIRRRIMNEQPPPSNEDLSLNLLEVGRFSTSKEGPAIAILQAIIKAGGDPNRAEASFVIGKTETPLLAAARAGDGILLRALLDVGATLGAGQSEADLQQLLLVGASRSGNLEEVQRLLQAGTDPSKKSVNGDLALAAAAKFSRTEIVEVLLASSADPNAWGSGQVSSLLSAVQAGNVQLASALLSSGADPKNKGDEEAWPLRAAVRRGDQVTTQLLLDAGAPLMERDKKGRTVLHDFRLADYALISNDTMERTLDAGHMDVVRFLGEKKFDFAVKDDRGRSVLSSILSYEMSDPVLLKAILDAGSPVDDGAILDAVRYHDAAAVEIMLPHHPDLSKPDFVEVALSEMGDSSFDILKSLVLAGAGLPSSTDAVKDLFVRAAGKGATEIVVELLRRGIKPTTTYGSKSALYAAVFEGQGATARLLFEKGADPRTTDYRGGTIFHELVRADGSNTSNAVIFDERQQRAIAELISAGLDAGAVDDNGKTALELAVGHPKTQERAVNAIGLATREASPVHDAVRDDNLQRLDELRSSGADITAEDSLGRSPLTLALQLKRYQIADYLLSAGVAFTLEPRNANQSADVDFASDPRLAEAFALRLLRSPLIHLNSSGQNAAGPDLAAFNSNQKMLLPDATWKLTCSPCTGEIVLSGTQQHELALDSRRWENDNTTTFKVQQILLEPVAVTGAINFELTWTVQTSLTVPQCKFEFATQPTCFPRVDIYNPNEPSTLTIRTSKGNIPLFPPTVIYAKQGDLVQTIAPGETFSLDRSVAPIEISIEPVVSKVFTLGIGVTEHIGPNIPQPGSLQFEERIKTYSQLAKWTYNLEKLPSSGRAGITLEAKTLSTAIHVLSARAIERNYPSHLRELLRQRAQDVAALDREAVSLRDAIVNQSELSGGDIDLLIARIDQQLMTAPPPAQRFLNELKASLIAAKDSVTRTNDSLRVFSERFYSDIDRVVRGYQSIILEYAQYVPNESLSDVVPADVIAAAAERLTGHDIVIADSALGGRGKSIRSAFGLPSPESGNE